MNPYKENRWVMLPNEDEMQIQKRKDCLATALVIIMIVIGISIFAFLDYIINQLDRCF